MGAINNFDCEGTLTIGGISINRAAWAVLGDNTGQGGLLPLWIYTEQRGEDRILPNAAGVIPYRRREAPTRHDLRLLITGDVDQNGAAVTDSRAGLATNLTYLETNVIQPTAATDGTRAATLTVFGAASRSANIHVLGLVPQEYHLSETSTIMVATLQISIPAGRFV